MAPHAPPHARTGALARPASATAVPPPAPSVPKVASEAAAKPAPAQVPPASNKAVAALTAVTHVSVPVETLRAIHAQLSAHADTILALLPSASPEAADEALSLLTASRLKQQAAQHK